MNKPAIMLVEDNADDELLTLRAFRRTAIPHDLTVVRDGAEALDYIFAQGQYSDRADAVLPTVLLLDLNLPKVHGLEVLRRIRADERTKLLPVVILTSSKEEHDVVGGYQGGCNSYVRKPVDYDEFADAARQLGLYWLVRNIPSPL